MSSARSFDHTPTPIRPSTPGARRRSVGLGKAAVRAPRLLEVAPTGPGPDLQQVTALLDAAARMLACPDPQTLLQTVAAEARDLLDADGVTIIASTRGGAWTPVQRAFRTTAVPEVAALPCPVDAAAELLRPVQLVELPADPADAAGDEPTGRSAWRSLLVADLPSPRTQERLRLLWHATTTGAFTGATDLASLFVRHAGLAGQAVQERHNLQQTVEVRTVTGQAVGILMCRYLLTAEQAFGVLRTHSQNHNIKVHTLAELIVDRGDLVA